MWETNIATETSFPPLKPYENHHPFGISKFRWWQCYSGLLKVIHQLLEVFGIEAHSIAGTMRMWSPINHHRRLVDAGCHNLSRVTRQSPRLCVKCQLLEPLGPVHVMNSIPLQLRLVTGGRALQGQCHHSVFACAYAPCVAHHQKAPRLRRGTLLQASPNR